MNTQIFSDFSVTKEEVRTQIQVVEPQSLFFKAHSRLDVITFILGIIMFSYYHHYYYSRVRASRLLLTVNSGLWNMFGQLSKLSTVFTGKHWH